MTGRTVLTRHLGTPVPQEVTAVDVRMVLTVVAVGGGGQSREGGHRSVVVRVAHVVAAVVGSGAVA